MEISQIETYIKSLIKDKVPSNYSIEDLIFSNLEVLNHVSTSALLSVNLRVKLHPAWLNERNQLSPGCLISILDSATAPLLLLFTKKASTSITMQLTISNPSISGDYLYLTYSCNPNTTTMIQVFLQVRDEEKLLATGTHFKLFLGFNYPNL